MNANFVSASIIMSKTEAKAAGKVNSHEFNELAALRAAYPTFRIVIRASKSKDSMKGLDTNYMERYIKAHDDAENTILHEFYALRGMDIAFDRADCTYYAISSAPDGKKLHREISKQQYNMGWKIYFDSKPTEGSYGAYVRMYNYIGGHPYKKAKMIPNAIYIPQINQLIELINNNFIS